MLTSIVERSALKSSRRTGVKENNQKLVDYSTVASIMNFQIFLCYRKNFQGQVRHKRYEK